RRRVSEIRVVLRRNQFFSGFELIEWQPTREPPLAPLASFFSAIALLLAVVGLYGVLHYAVQQRRREIAIRMTLGAQVPSVARLVALPLVAIVVAGSASGLLAGLFSARYISELFYQVKATEARMLAFPCLAIAS